jgi:hypothetical protein
MKNGKSKELKMEKIKASFRIKLLLKMNISGLKSCNNKVRISELSVTDNYVCSSGVMISHLRASFHFLVSFIKKNSSIKSASRKL